MRIRRAQPDGLAAAFMLAFLATAGFFYINIMAAIVTGLIDGLHLSAAAAGRIGACNIYGAAAGALGAVFIVRRVSWRAAALGLLCCLIGLDLASTLIRSASLLTAVRSLHGFAGGLLVGISYAVFARTRSPDRCFAMLMVVQSSLGGLGLMFLPRLVPLFGTPVLFLALAAFSIAALSMLPFIADYPLRTATGTGTGTGGANLAGAASGRGRRLAFAWPLLLALLAVFFFQAGNMALSAYIIELGRAYGLGLQFITTWIGLSGWAATLGALLVVAFGTRWGRTRPVVAGTLAAILGNAAFHASHLPFVFAAANVATAIVWFFTVPYLLGVCAAFDRTGRSAALAGLFSKLGYATGPFAASLLIGGGAPSYGNVVNLAVAALAMSAVCGIAAARLADRPALKATPATAREILER